MVDKETIKEIVSKWSKEEKEELRKEIYFRRKYSGKNYKKSL